MPDLFGEGGEGQQLCAGVVEVFGDLGQLIGQRVQHPIILGDNGFCVWLIENGVQDGAYPRPGRLGGDRHQVGADQPRVRVTGHQRHSGQAVGDQVAEESQPAGPVLGGGDLHAQDFAIALGVDPGGD